MKKTVATILIIVSVLCCSLAFIGCNKNQDNAESFVGAVSKTTYESKEDAVKGFLEEEISGEAFTATYIGYTKSNDLSQKEIKNLAIEEKIKNEIVSVEKGDVEYSEKTNAQGESLVKLSTKSCRRVVYIIGCSNDDKTIYRFYVPANEEGETPSKSSFKSILDVENYKNCTLRSEWKYHNTMEIEGSEDVVLLQTADMKINSETVSGRGGVKVIADGKEKIELRENGEYYSVYLDKNLYTVEKAGDDLNIESDANEKISDYVNGLLMQYFDVDHSCFEKSDKGYKISKERYLMLSGEDGSNTDLENFDFDYEFIIILSKGKIIEASCKSLFSIENKLYGVNWKLEFSDFGTTKVEIPKEVTNAIAEYKSNNK